ncbi:MAG: DUF4150 domain-containing protein [Polyangiaceae bacterium]|nr:DUF4150 domain-containing protein [Polyangiaceae bacterium]
MLPASNRGVGMSLGFPDVCLTPSPAGPVPVPYPNIAMNAQAAPFAASVKVNMMNALNLASQIPLTSGDEAGSAHPSVKGPQRYSMGSPNVFVEGMPGITLASLTSHNNMNCPVGAVIVPSAVNVMFSRVADDHGPACSSDPRCTRGLDLAGLVELGDAARGETVASVMLDGDAGTIRIATFSLGAGAEIYTAIESLVTRGARSLSIDLRGVRGGALEGAIDAAGHLLPEGAVVVVEIEADGDETEHRSEGGGFVDVVVEVLVDEITASAAEVFAGALQANGRARILGTRTFGKGVTHRVAVGALGGSVSARMSTLRLSNGDLLDGLGISPDD